MFRSRARTRVGARERGRDKADSIPGHATSRRRITHVDAPSSTARQATITLDFGRLSIDPRAREVRVSGTLVPLTAREFDLLEMLASHPRQVLTRDTIFGRLWGPYGDRHSLTVHIGRLRDEIERDPANPEIITTVWGVGYRFEGTPS